jgi:serine/threonine protein kinase/uncharacterized RDD family membrane protein YckC
VVASAGKDDEALADTQATPVHETNPPPRPEGAPLVGRLIDHFRVDELLGQGGMGAVYRAWDTSLFRPVALKTLLVDSATARARFMREARAQARIRHPNVVAIHAVGEVDGCVFLVMDLVEGEPLDEKLARCKVLPEAEVLAIADAVAAALESAHAEGLVHRDIKPANILMERSGRVLLADFGLAKALAAEPSKEEHLALATTVADDEAMAPTERAPLQSAAGTHVSTLQPVTRSGAPPSAIVRANELAITRVGGLVGSPFYMAPEQFRGEACDHRADMYALGATLYELLLGHAALTAPTLEALSVAVQTQPPRFPETCTVRQRTQALILRLMEKNVADRFDHYGAIRHQLVELRRSPSPRAPLFGRITAFVIDVALGWVIVGALAGIRIPAPVGWLVASAVFATIESRWGRSIGKRALQLDVESDDGGPIGWRRATFRGFFRLYLPVVAIVLLEASQRLARIAAKDEAQHYGPEALLSVVGGALLLLWMVAGAFVFGQKRKTLYDRWTHTTIVASPQRDH